MIVGFGAGPGTFMRSGSHGAVRFSMSSWSRTERIHRPCLGKLRSTYCEQQLKRARIRYSEGSAHVWAVLCGVCSEPSCLRRHSAWPWHDWSMSVLLFRNAWLLEACCLAVSELCWG